MLSLGDKQIELGITRLIKLILPYSNKISYKKLLYLPRYLTHLKL